MRYYADMLAVASLFLLAEGVPALTLPEFEALPSGEAAERALEGREHGPIASVERPEISMRPPRTTEFLLFEEPQAVARGCRRPVWSLTIRARAHEPRTEKL